MHTSRYGILVVNTVSKSRLGSLIYFTERSAAPDKSWRVRHELARIFPSLIEGFGMSINELVPTFLNLIKDSETEVKIAALEGLEKVVKCVSAEKVSICIIPAILNLGNESSSHVKDLIG